MSLFLSHRNRIPDIAPKWRYSAHISSIEHEGERISQLAPSATPWNRKSFGPDVTQRKRFLHECVKPEHPQQVQLCLGMFRVVPQVEQQDVQD